MACWRLELFTSVHNDENPCVSLSKTWSRLDDSTELDFFNVCAWVDITEPTSDSMDLSRTLGTIESKTVVSYVLRPALRHIVRNPQVEIHFSHNLTNFYRYIIYSRWKISTVFKLNSTLYFIKRAYLFKF